MRLHYAHLDNPGQPLSLKAHDVSHICKAPLPRKVTHSDSWDYNVDIFVGEAITFLSQLLWQEALLYILGKK